MTVFVDVVGGSGPNLTLLHGWGLNSRVWDGVKDVLAERFTLHLIDLPGHGRSQGAAVTSLDAFVSAVAQAMPQRSHLLGWSLGGHTALALAAAQPQRVDRLVTVCCTPRFIAAEDWPQGKRAEVLADFARRLGNSYSATIRNFLALQALNMPEMRDVIRALYEAVEAHGAPSIESLAATLEILKVSDIRAQIPHIKSPTLVVQGDHDALTSTASAEWLAANLVNSTYCLMEHAAHAPFLSHRDAFLSHVMGFLDS
jgi:pimeloyl-[acyl-carrier protein] methyl ester esterase